MIDNLATRQAYLVDKAAEDLQERRLAASKSQDLNTSIIGSGMIAVGFAAKAESQDSQLNDTTAREATSHHVSSPPATKFQAIPLSNSPPKTNNEFLTQVNAYNEAKQEFRSRSNSGNKPSHMMNVRYSGSGRQTPSQQPMSPIEARHVQSSKPSPVEFSKEQKNAQDIIDALFAKSMMSPQ